MYDNALQAASLYGNTSTVELLLNAGANVNAQGGRYGNALQAASSLGHTKIMQLLLNAGAIEEQELPQSPPSSSLSSTISSDRTVSLTRPTTHVSAPVLVQPQPPETRYSDHADI
jgi:ankyrin repeat protein